MFRRLPIRLLFLLLLSSCHSGTDSAPLPEEASLPDRPASATLIFTGDIMLHGRQLEAARRPDGSYDFTPSFRAVKPLLESADLTVGNLELCLPGAPPYRGYPTFRAPDELALALREAGFDLLTTANNHALDAGREGLRRTARTLREYGFYQTGTFLHERDRRRNHPLLVYVNELEIAFLNYTYPAPGLRSAGSLISTLDLEQIRADLRQAHLEKPDAILVLLHWGEEYQNRPTAEQRELGLQLLRWGADAVIGAHPHVVQPVERYTFRMRSGERREKWLAWSLGNFISNQDLEGTEAGLMLKLRLEKDPRLGKARISEWEHIPVWRHRGRREGRLTFTVVPDSPEGPALAGLDSLERRSMQQSLQALQAFLDSTAVRQ